jgi:hypothetical protein
MGGYLAAQYRVRFSLSDLRDGHRCPPVAVTGGRLVWVG